MPPVCDVNGASFPEALPLEPGDDPPLAASLSCPSSGGVPEGLFGVGRGAPNQPSDLIDQPCWRNL